MIIQRLASMLRRHDWGMITLEVLIVVVGIFVGLRVEDWNEARKDRATETAFLERLRADTLFNIEQVSFKAESYQGRADSLERIVAAMQAGTVGDIDVDDLTAAFCYWYVPEGVRLKSSTYLEMTSTGGLELISDPDVREHLQMAWAEHERAQEENPKLTVVQVELARHLRDFIEWRFDAPSQEVESEDTPNLIRAGCEVDTAALAARPEMTSVLVQLNRSQTILGNLHLWELQALQQLLAALDASLSR